MIILTEFHMDWPKIVDVILFSTVCLIFFYSHLKKKVILASKTLFLFFTCFKQIFMMKDSQKRFHLRLPKPLLQYWCTKSIQARVWFITLSLWCFSIWFKIRSGFMLNNAVENFWRKVDKSKFRSTRAWQNLWATISHLCLRSLWSMA